MEISHGLINMYTINMPRAHGKDNVRQWPPQILSVDRAL